MPASTSLYSFTDNVGSFEAKNPERFNQLYFPLVNEAGLMSAITPRLQGDIKLGQHHFVNQPVSIDDLHVNRTSRNFWISLASAGKKVGWSVAGASAWQRALADGDEAVDVTAGLLWHQVRRTNKKIGLEATVLNFIPTRNSTFEIMRVHIKNISKKKISFIATSAIPLFGRSADNIRDHRHVTSLLHRISASKFGLSLCPTMSFNERGHHLNSTTYFVVGADGAGAGPAGFFPTVESFIGAGGNLEKPEAIFKKAPLRNKIVSTDQGKEFMGALQFKPRILAPGQTAVFTLLIGAHGGDQSADTLMKTMVSTNKVDDLLNETKNDWANDIAKIEFQTRDALFNNWVRWVQVQPTLRKLFGCSFLPDFDYGKGGRGWRDLWQDCLALLLANPTMVRDMIVKNFAGIRIDGSNATIIGRDGKNVTFIADRNNITRTWMDHGIWPFLTTELYLNQTGDWDLLTEDIPYFRDAQLRRAKKLDTAFSASPQSPCVLKTTDRSIYKGSLIEHVLVQNLVQFFNVGEHNCIRLEDADWNDGLDMAHERGESVAFTSMYAANLDHIAQVLDVCQSKCGWSELPVAKELLLLLDRIGNPVSYNDTSEKQARLAKYFDVTEGIVSGEKVNIKISSLIADLRAKAQWIKEHVNRSEWVKANGEFWINGYYDNKGLRVEGVVADKRVRMTLTGQVYPIMAGTVDAAGARSISRAVDKFLWDKKLGGIRLNTDFGDIQPALGRAFSFAYGEKENGAVFSHMVVMYANALYSQGLADEGHRALHSLYRLATNTEKSQIFPGLPEYFNNEGRGRYHYLTGSASWYVLTLFTQVFGIQGKGGDLLIHPKLHPSYFDKTGHASVSFNFADSRIHVVYENPKKIPYEQIRDITIVCADGDIEAAKLTERSRVIARDVISRRKNWNFNVRIN